MNCSNFRKREYGRSLSLVAYGNKIHSITQRYHKRIILPTTKIIFDDVLQLCKNAPMYGTAISRKLTVYGRFAAPFPSLFAPSRKRADLRPRHRRKIEMTTGTVKFFNESKGYGFIAPDGGGNDAFVHVTAVERAGMRSLRENQRVSYDLEQDNRGKMSAVNLKNAEESPQASANKAEPANDELQSEPANDQHGE